MSTARFHTILFHALYDESQRDVPKHPTLFVSTRELAECIDVFIKAGYTFLHPNEIFSSLDSGKGVLLTFDDGYFNNFLALDILDRFDIPALFFPVEQQIRSQRCFWWDVYFRNRIKEVSFEILYAEIQDLKRLTRSRIEAVIMDRFGPDCFDVETEMDRPMTCDELKRFSQHDKVNIGVHSASHEILTNLSFDTVIREIKTCKTFLESIVGDPIDFISYPNGNHSDEIVDIAADLGFTRGVTTIPGPNYVNELQTSKDWLTLKRNVFPIPGDSRPVPSHVEEFIARGRIR